MAVQTKVNMRLLSPSQRIEIVAKKAKEWLDQEKDWHLPKARSLKTIAQFTSYSLLGKSGRGTMSTGHRGED